MDKNKTFIRKKALSLRASITKSDRERWNKAISERFLALDSVAKHSSFSCYVSIGTEVATMAIINALTTLGKWVSVPIILSEHEMGFAPLSRDTLEFSRTFKPTFDRSINTNCVPEVSIIPTVAASRNGARIGYGRGYYDRWLSKNKYTKKIALAFNCQLFNDIVAEEHDQKLDQIITEEELIPCRN